MRLQLLDYVLFTFWNRLLLFLAHPAESGLVDLIVVHVFEADFQAALLYVNEISIKLIGQRNANTLLDLIHFHHVSNTDLGRLAEVLQGLNLVDNIHEDVFLYD